MNGLVVLGQGKKLASLNDVVVNLIFDNDLSYNILE